MDPDFVSGGEASSSSKSECESETFDPMPSKSKSTKLSALTSDTRSKRCFDDVVRKDTETSSKENGHSVDSECENLDHVPLKVAKIATCSSGVTSDENINNSQPKVHM